MGRRSRLRREDEANGANPDANGANPDANDANLNSDLAVRIISIIQEQPDISQSEIAEKLALSRRTVQLLTKRAVPAMIQTLFQNNDGYVCVRCQEMPTEQKRRTDEHSRGFQGMGNDRN